MATRLAGFTILPKPTAMVTKQEIRVHSVCSSSRYVSFYLQLRLILLLVFVQMNQLRARHKLDPMFAAKKTVYKRYGVQATGISLQQKIGAGMNLKNVRRVSFSLMRR